MNELFNKYPRFKGVNGVDLQTWEICPIGVESQHDGQRYTMTKKAAEKFAKELDHTPLVYANIDEGLPSNHKDKFNKRTVIGSALDGYIITGEDGIERLVGDYLIYEDSDEDIINKIKASNGKASASWELHQALADDAGNIYDGFYGATAVMDADESAYRHHALLVAERTNVESEPVETKLDINIIYDEALKKLVGDDYQSKLDELQSKLDEYKEQIKEKEARINELNDTNSSLRKINDKFSKLIQ
jgi:hypothetical protein